ncbi:MULTISPECIES: hypothetical protein [unclassified Rhodococcus (in: high G+C Gram-positive bacteria)]|uniref:hypothetical protein n=1 Tax=unclassified Rhodococcus (in: high G+C Gram-positive bacteria) TaxID=192944 RepID=UPI0011B29539|nr:MULTISPECIES: hypothetical protein [unclassified Rhodococcus (in: high G+C Gram-positive bacteria)]
MTTVHVRANQTTVDWAEGAEFVCERTPFVDNLIQHGGLTELEGIDAPDAFETDRDLAYEKYAEASHEIDVAYSNVDSSAEDRRRAELALEEAQKNAASSQKDLTETRSDAADTIAELNADLDTEPPKPPRTRRKTT